MFRQLTPSQLDNLEDSLIRGILDHLSHTGFSRCHLGLSGGIDSAIVAYLAVQAIGKDNVVCLILPSRFTSQSSLDDAAELANRLGCRHETISIEPLYAGFLEALRPLFAGRPTDTTEENLQARIRGTILMAYANKFHSMLLATGNKSEIAMGYCTLYGDTCGGLLPIGSLYKTEVFALCRRINEKSRQKLALLHPGNDTFPDIIPENIITKPPSAELRPNQTDQDSLPPYEILDAFLQRYYVEQSDRPETAAEVSLDNIVGELGISCDLAEQIIRTVKSMEFKRQQSPPVLVVHRQVQ